MGADLLLSYLTIDSEKRVDLEAGRLAIERLASTPLEEWPWGYLDQWKGEDVPADPDEAAALRAELVEQLRDDLEVIEALVPGHDQAGYRRDVWVGDIGGKQVIASGGMSWGDAPTDAFESLERLGDAGISRAMGFDW